MCGSRRTYFLIRILAGLALSAACAGQVRAADSYLGLQRSAPPPASQHDRGVRQASFHEPFGADAGSARLGERDSRQTISQAPLEIGKSKTTSSPWRALGTVMASLIAVLGLFFGVLWLVRKNMPAAAGRLPSDVVEVLGHAPLAARRQMQLVRFGDKLLLLCISQTGVDTLAEIDRPEEVARLRELCGAKHSTGAEGAFQQVFGKRARVATTERAATNSGLAAMAMQKRRPGTGEDAA